MAFRGVSSIIKLLDDHRGDWSYRALIRYSARLMLAWEPVMVTCLSVEPSTGLAILIWAPDIWRISLIFAPWRPMMQPMSWGGKTDDSHRGRHDRKISPEARSSSWLTSFGMVSSWEPVCAEASIPAGGNHRNHSECPGHREPKLELTQRAQTSSSCPFPPKLQLTAVA